MMNDNNGSTQGNTTGPVRRKQQSEKDSTMVQMKRRKRNFATEFTMSGHYCNLLLFFSICFCGGLYMLLQSKEQRIAGHSNLKTGVATALPDAVSMVGRPHLVYGTAWKKEETARYVAQAVKAGFRFIDTACQPKHYNEAGVGDGWTAAAQELGLSREHFWLQTKFTSVNGQDPNILPYDKNAPIADQIRTSLEVSLKNLHTDHLDSWVMHSPFPTVGETLDAWKVMEEAVDNGKVRQLGMSNCYSIDVFREIYNSARHKPKVLQNRFRAETNFDTELRQFCKENKIQYQSFWTLTANRKALASKEAKVAAKRYGLTAQTYMFAFLMSLGYVTPLSGTTSIEHMAQDVAIMERIQKGETFFHNEEELRDFAHLLGMPDL